MSSLSLAGEILQLWRAFSFQKLPETYIHVMVASGSSCIFAGYVGLHSFFLDKYRNFFQLYKNGFETKITPEITNRINQVTKDMKLSKLSQSYLDSFFTSGFEPIHIGTFRLRWGACIGIPGNYVYKSTNDIEREYIVNKGKPISWNSESGELFQESLILSEGAQKFAIARELFSLENNYPFTYGLTSAAAGYFQYLTANFLSIKTYGHLKPKSFRYTLYSIVAIFTYGLWSTATDNLTKYYENWADKHASALGLEYAKGGVEFYTKLARRNASSRELLGATGEKLYTVYGNYNNEILRQRHLQVSERKERAEQRVEDYLRRQEHTEVS